MLPKLTTLFSTLCCLVSQLGQGSGSEVQRQGSRDVEDLPWFARVEHGLLHSARL